MKKPIVEFHFTGRSSFKRLWTDPNEIPNLLATSGIVSFLLPRTCPLALSTLSSLWLAHNAPNVRRLQQKCHRLWPWKRTQKLAFFPLSAARKCQSSSGLNENLTHTRSCRRQNRKWHNMHKRFRSRSSFIPSSEWISRLCLHLAPEIRTSSSSVT